MQWRWVWVWVVVQELHPYLSPVQMERVQMPLKCSLEKKGRRGWGGGKKRFKSFLKKGKKIRKAR